MEVSAAARIQYDLENILRLLTKKHNSITRILLKDVNSVVKKEDVVKEEVPERRSSISDSKPFKKIKLSTEKTQKSFTGRAKHAKSQEFGFPEKSDVSKLLKDSPSRFWAFMDCFCSDITMEDIKILEKWIESHNSDPEYQTIPELGPHYRFKWIEDDVLDEQKEGTKSMENPKGTDIACTESILENELYRKVQEKIVVDSEQPTFVEKLISSLVQENIISAPNDIMTVTIPDDEDIQDPKTNGTSNLESNNNTLESRLRAQFIEEGILQEADGRMEDDELLVELKRLQSLLIPVSKINQRKKEALLQRAKAELSKQQSMKRIQEVDAKIMESYRAVTAIRIKGKKMSKKELSQIRSILDEREALIQSSKLVT